MDRDFLKDHFAWKRGEEEEEGENRLPERWALFYPQAQKLLGLVLLIVFVSGSFLLLFLQWSTPARPEITKVPSAPAEVLSATPSSFSGRRAELTVYLTGAVQEPGLHRLPEGSRLADLLTLAGGLNEEADAAWVEKNLNLAEKLFDGQKIIIPRRGELSAATPSNLSTTVLGQRTGKINLNTASIAELEKLPGIGSSAAARIVEYRQRFGPFQRIEEIQKVSGIKTGIFEKIKDLITVY